MTDRSITCTDYESAVAQLVDEGVALDVAASRAASELGLPQLPKADLLAHCQRAGLLVDPRYDRPGVLGFGAEGQLVAVGSVGDRSAVTAGALVRGVEYGYVAPVDEEAAQPVAEPTEDGGEPETDEPETDEPAEPTEDGAE